MNLATPYVNSRIYFMFLFILNFALTLQLKKESLWMDADHSKSMELLRRNNRGLVNSQENGDTESLFHTFPLALGYGTHYAEIYIGTPSQSASVIVDTGSHMTAFPCKTCKNCGVHTDPPYDIEKSSTNRYLNCTEFPCYECSENQQCFAHQRYSEQSTWEAIMIEDNCGLGDIRPQVDGTKIDFSKRCTFGCQTYETGKSFAEHQFFWRFNGLFISQKANGIMGMSYHKNSIIKTFLESNSLPEKKNIFSLCFGNIGGRMTIGGINTTSHQTSIEYAKMTIAPSVGWYVVELLDILVGNQSIGVNSSEYNSGRGIILDSGTTETYLTESAMEPLSRIFKEQTGNHFPRPGGVKYDIQNVENLPPLSFVFKGVGQGDSTVKIDIPPKQYLVHSNNNIMSSFHFDQNNLGGVLGASFMKNLDVIFDIDNGQAGFASADCDYGTSELDSNSEKTSNTVLFYAIILAVGAIVMLALIGLFRKKSTASWNLVESEDDCDDEGKAIHDRESFENPSTVIIEEASPRHFSIDDDDEEEEIELVSCVKEPTELTEQQEQSNSLAGKPVVTSLDVV